MAGKSLVHMLESSFLFSLSLPPPPSSMGNAQEMVRQAKLLAEATSSLINAIKREAEAETDPDPRKKLLDAAKALADATALMVEAAKVAARNPHDEEAQENLRKAAEHLRAVTNAAASNALKKKAIKKLEVAAKQAAAVSTQCIAAAQGAAASNRNEASQFQLINHCKAVAEQISSLVQAVRLSMSNQDSPSAQLGLINSSQAMIPVGGAMWVSMNVVSDFICPRSLLGRWLPRQRLPCRQWETRPQLCSWETLLKPRPVPSLS